MIWACVVVWLAVAAAGLGEAATVAEEEEAAAASLAPPAVLACVRDGGSGVGAVWKSRLRAAALLPPLALTGLPPRSRSGGAGLCTLCLNDTTPSSSSSSSGLLDVEAEEEEEALPLPAAAGETTMPLSSSSSAAPMAPMPARVGVVYRLGSDSGTEEECPPVATFLPQRLQKCRPCNAL
jgi:hypothetical protein